MPHQVSIPLCFKVPCCLHLQGVKVRKNSHAECRVYCVGVGDKGGGGTECLVSLWGRVVICIDQGVGVRALLHAPHSTSTFCVT
jgi:hypothetical protein